MELQTEIVQIEKNKKLGAQTQNAPQITKTHKQDAFKPEEYQKQKQNKTKRRRARSTAEAKAKRRAASIPEAELIKPNQNLQSTNKKADGDDHHHHKEKKKEKMTPPPNKAQDNKTDKPIILLPPVGSNL